VGPIIGDTPRPDAPELHTGKASQLLHTQRLVMHDLDFVGLTESRGELRPGLLGSTHGDPHERKVDSNLHGFLPGGASARAQARMLPPQSEVIQACSPSTPPSRSP
jgi:hypothetical protein